MINKELIQVGGEVEDEGYKDETQPRTKTLMGRCPKTPD